MPEQGVQANDVGRAPLVQPFTLSPDELTAIGQYLARYAHSTATTNVNELVQHQLREPVTENRPQAGQGGNPEAAMVPDELAAYKANREARVNVESPFTWEILDVPIPRNFKPPVLATYDGSTDLVQHVNMFERHMELITSDDSLYCRAFP